MSTFYVYIDWTQEEIPRPIYVGKALKGRVNCLKRNKKHTWAVSRFGQRREIVFETNDESLAFDVEITLIWFWDTFNPNFKDFDDLRCNHTRGGEGVSGFIASKETRKKLSEIKKGTKYWAGRHHSEETKRKMSISKMGNKYSVGPRVSLTQEHRRKIGDKLNGRHHQISEETKRKISLALKSYHNKKLTSDAHLPS